MTEVLITGASRGIGKALALDFVTRLKDVRLYLVARDEKKLEEVKKECFGISAVADVIAISCSLEEEKSFTHISKIVSEKSSHLDAVIHNAGFLLNRPFEQIDLASLEKTYRINVHAPYLLTQALLPVLGGATPSHVVNIGSMGGVQGQSKFPGLSAYSPSKMALVGLTESLAEELKGRNIFVNCLALGAVNTEMLAEAFPGYKAQISPEEMASYIAEFSLTGHRLYNGKILPVALSTP
jgi:3-oxoacyl-[acyl-carrier protein] reductase